MPARPAPPGFPVSHNIPVFAEGIAGAEILARQRVHAERYGARILAGTVTALDRSPGHFSAIIEGPEAPTRPTYARRVLLATGAEDIEPDLPDLPDAVRRGLVRYCPICDGYEARGRRIAVIGHGDRGMGEAIFIARTYSSDVTLLTLGQRMELSDEQRERLAQHGVKLVEAPIQALDVQDGRITALRPRQGEEYRFDILYSALGLQCRSGLGSALGARLDGSGALLVDAHNRTTVPGLYAAGGTVRGLDQIVVAMGHAAIAATHIHNHCEIPTEDEPREEA
ncbi:NAD(P)/FAD-dependent oxidoreductase [Siccirubricoccus sp. G192]|uniref:NAD(P)/FAD-dependent oxidoreductase n=1 Tax=Siccirubricoccus sp. G192 TaxID=2849651 RepID=UPI0020C32910|nr:NAD(P)/FAD-dependent oxidoreductase [Siccirubricoccus sp. G192]